MEGYFIFLGLGSNIEPRMDYLKMACLGLKEHLKDMRCSSVYETDPQDFLDQDPFLNAVVCGWTDLSQKQWLDVIQNLEEKAQRKRLQDKGPRTLDIDVLDWSAPTSSRKKLQVPHPSLVQRQFALIPLLELDPERIHGQSGKSYRSISEKLGPQGIRTFASPESLLS